ncbi:hypothetical protein N6H13_01745 [Paenibacillus sp. CC-CFT742]|nr:hypothetical protein [Paenibacillus sp. CC-CFT742]WJH29541.1 hypothetical protein N6H13_01745 [Paenibacillus sp. CC-CFT742]
MWEKQALSFHFENLENEEIHSVNPWKSGYMDSLMTSDYNVIEKGKMRWSYTFKYLPENEPYRFVLDGYSIAEVDGSKFSFKPAELSEPKSFKVLKDKLDIIGTSLEKSQNGGEADELAVLFYGEMQNEIRNDEWKAYDSAGKQYNVSKRGASTLMDTLSNHWGEGFIGMGDRNMANPYEYRIEGLDHIPEELSLVREVVDKRYKDPNWSVMLNE